MGLTEEPGRRWPRPRALARSRRVRWTAVVLVVAGLLTWGLAPSDDAPYPRGRISFSTGVGTGVYALYGKLLKPPIERELPGVRVDLVPSEGSVENVRRVATGKTTLTVAAADAVAAYTGPGRERLRACARLYDDYVQLVVEKDSPVRTVADLRGRRVGVGQAESGVRLLSERVLRAAGLDPQRDVSPRYLGIDTAPTALRRGELDAFFWSGGLPTARLARYSEEFELRLVPLGHLVEAMREQGGPEGGSYYRQATIPRDAYPEMVQRDAVVSTISVPNLLVTTDQTDPALMERLTRAVIDNRDEIGNKVHAAQQLDLRTAIYTAPLPLHEGSERYYRSVKP
ncbi:hypothetical protein AQ490_01570 [Wenjunlia vitaminophila]|uniref:TAXI family TRAP transporter solute-binding subunit n=2 Tax=Wenjunlia vitaminophila TaxID=76728 RepID=A0A0T6M0K4_WENVI|nr:TAXI family TRAP transporter solute-binding subunit [Wenjunlia vitaminophila]KRV51532.1 hypothetical protein AQ490_01570 [Wenjunlia vitaminophila]